MSTIAFFFFEFFCLTKIKKKYLYRIVQKVHDSSRPGQFTNARSWPGKILIRNGQSSEPMWRHGGRSPCSSAFVFPDPFWTRESSWNGGRVIRDLSRWHFFFNWRGWSIDREYFFIFFFRFKLAWWSTRETVQMSFRLKFPGQCWVLEYFWVPVFFLHLVYPYKIPRKVDILKI